MIWSVRLPLRLWTRTTRSLRPGGTGPGPSAGAAPAARRPAGCSRAPRSARPTALLSRLKPDAARLSSFHSPSLSRARGGSRGLRVTLGRDRRIRPATRTPDSHVRFSSSRRLLLAAGTPVPTRCAGRDCYGHVLLRLRPPRFSKDKTAGRRVAF